MSELYSECLVKKESKAKDAITKYGLIVLTVLSVAAGLFFHPLAFVLAVGLGIADYFIIPKTDLEYEYLFVNGELESGTYYSSIQEGGVGLLISPEIRGNLPTDKQARFDEACEKIDQALADIQSGDLVIERNIEK